MFLTLVSGRRRSIHGLILFTVLALLATVLASSPARAAEDDLAVIVTSVDGSVASAAAAVDAAGGEVDAELGIVGGVAATVPAGSLAELAADPEVRSATIDGTLSPRDDDDDDAGWSGDSNGTSLYEAASTINAQDYWYSGYRGDGVDVAVIDTGVSPVEGMHRDNKLINGVDVSFESQSDQFRYLDTNGHGTHMAGIIAAYDPGDDSSLKGIAYKSRIVNVKVGAHDGSVDVSQVIAAIDWVVQHKNDNGLNIRVLNLSYGTDGTQNPSVDPLSFAVEQAWKAGIVVVVAGGNDGPGVSLNNPATNPYVIAVGAADGNGNSQAADDSVASFSSCGIGRTVDVVAPGRSIQSLRVENSTSDLDHPEARITVYGDDDRWDLFKGSGSSQAAAVVSGAAALIIDQRPGITPDQLKQLLIDSAQPVAGSADCQGAGQIDLGAAEHMATPSATQSHTFAAGTGTLEGARGNHHVGLDGVDLVGEVDIHGTSWSGTSWSTAAANGTSWSGGDWNGTSWSGTSWSGTSWSGTSWSGTSWSGTSWSGTSWSGTSWSNQTWTGTSWSGTSWSGTSWSGTSWSGTSWTGLSWGSPVMY